MRTPWDILGPDCAVGRRYGSVPINAQWICVCASPSLCRANRYSPGLEKTIESAVAGDKRDVEICRGWSMEILAEEKKNTN